MYGGVTLPVYQATFKLLDENAFTAYLDKGTIKNTITLGGKRLDPAFNRCQGHTHKFGLRHRKR